LTVQYLDWDGDAALLDRQRALAWVNYGDGWEAVHQPDFTDLVFKARIIDEKRFKKMFPDVGLPQELEADGG